MISNEDITNYLKMRRVCLRQYIKFNARDEITKATAADHELGKIE